MKTIIILILLLSGCAVTTTITPGENGSIVIKSKSDSIVTYKTAAIEASVNNQGKTPIAETILTGTLARVVSNPVTMEPE